MIVYYQYCSIPKKGRNPSFAKFKTEHIPFYWDKINKEEYNIDGMNEAEGLTPQDWAERIAKLHPVGSIPASQLKDI